jgi:hypothetical protein
LFPNLDVTVAYLGSPGMDVGGQSR